MNINDLIHSLSEEEVHIDPILSEKQFMSLYLVVSLALITLGVVILPLRASLDHKLASIHYYIESFSWMMIGLSGASLSYRNLVPGQLVKKILLLNISFVLLLIFSILLRLDYQNLSSHLVRESDLLRGYCGPIILIMGSVAFYFLKTKLEKGFYNNKMSLCYSLGCALGAIGSLTMQYICIHENSAHILLWHLPPLMLLALFSGKLVKKL